MTAIADPAAADLAPVRPAPTREQIETVEQVFSQLPQVHIETTHRFVGGMYVREIRIPAGVIMTGAVHKSEHLSVMVSGAMTVSTDRGMEYVEGYHVWTPKPGTKRVGYAHADTIWLTVHRTNAKTAEDAEDILFEQPDRLLARRWASLPPDMRAEAPQLPAAEVVQ